MWLESLTSDDRLYVAPFLSVAPSPGFEGFLTFWTFIIIFQVWLIFTNVIRKWRHGLKGGGVRDCVYSTKKRDSEKNQNCLTSFVEDQ